MKIEWLLPPAPVKKMQFTTNGTWLYLYIYLRKQEQNKKNPLTQAQIIGNAASQIRLVADQV